MATINYSNFSTATGAWQTNPSQPYLYSLIDTDVLVSESESYITFNNLPAGMTVAAAPTTTAPFDSVYFNNDYANLLLQSGANNRWTGNVGALLMAAYTSGGYWAFGASGAVSPGVIFTGSGNANSVITDIVWESSYGAAGTPPVPFNNSSFGGLYSWNETIANEIYSSYQVINSNTIKVSTNFESLDTSLRKLYVKFNKP